MTNTFKWNRSYDDHEQVREYLPAFIELRAAMEAKGEYPYNDSFRSLIPGIVGDDEDTGIYLLQGLYRIEAEHRRIAAYRADGFEPLVALTSTTRFERVVVYHEGYYSGGTGMIHEYESARVLPDETGKPWALLPRGKRVNGHALTGACVLVK